MRSSCLHGKAELLSPAGSMDAVKAALANGADALYMGGAFFGARAGAGFDEEELRTIIRLCHLHKRHVHITFNTLIKENEFEKADQQLQMLSRLQTDALIVQDAGLMRYIREKYPEFELHLSTQMSLHNAAGARFAMQNGADRMVLARECDMETIRSVCETGIDTEVFVHGALCVSVSGQCLFSSMIGGRSGNRGRCAQPCRLDYTYRGTKGAWLSPRDICLIDQLPQLISAGVDSFKIEGRLKRAEYTALVTAAYRKALDACLEGRFEKADEDTRETLLRIFSRGGFSAGYPGKAQDAAVIYEKRVSPQGIVIGTAKGNSKKGAVILCNVSLTENLHNGDGLEIGSDRVIYSGPDITKGNIVAIRLHTACKPGTPVLRIDDEALLCKARASYSREGFKQACPLPFDAELFAYPGKTVRLTVTHGDISVTCVGDVCDAATGAGLTSESVSRALSKAGDTPFTLGRVQLESSGAYIPVSSLNRLRQTALASLEEKLSSIKEPVLHVYQPMLQKDHSRNELKPSLYVVFGEPAQAASLQQAGADHLIFAPNDYRTVALKATLSQLPKRCYVALPVVCRDETLQDILRLIREQEQIPCPASIGQLSFTEEAFGPAMESIPVFNRRTITLLKEFECTGAVLSPELSLNEIRDLDPEPFMILPLHGRQRLMTLTHCPERTFRGLQTGKEDCTLCDQGHGARGECLTDRLGCNYPLQPMRLPEGCRVQLMHHQITDLSSLQKEVSSLNCSFLADIRGEEHTAAIRVVRRCRSILMGEPVSSYENFTIGRRLDGVL